MVQGDCEEKGIRKKGRRYQKLGRKEGGAVSAKIQVPASIPDEKQGRRKKTAR